MKKRILIPTDFSKNAWNAIKYAVELYKREYCEFYILHTYFHSGFSNDNLLIPKPTEAALGIMQTVAEKDMQKLKLLMGYCEENENHSFQYINEFGQFFDVLKKTIEKEDIELIIMGTRGETDNKDFIFGSNAVNVMEKMRNCPVMAIPGNVIYKDPNEIVFPTSFKTHYKQKELKTLIEMAKLTNAPIRILHIHKGKPLSKEQAENRILLESILDSVKYTHHQLYDVDLQTGVRCFVQSRESEMIAIVNKKHHLFGSVFSNPMVKELGKHSNVPLLAMHDLRN
ncbi:universal stress protein UspA [Aequorivita soesokkakensis]|uniref:Universal stress protein UspA n=1 Tax=Aequorivita soesokkakensis TaxID=1385699 RepID=A0A1A9LA67_9FLAO|nr:universal stress protein [Aequorivita soesokkakensis]OAD90249.1 universal stress protein UspA [Aequorivita soesokkakensis]